MNKTNDYTIALVGNPNCGKSTLFNALTGAGASVGNWPGVTVEVKTGQFQYQGKQFTVVDLPGTYALNQPSEDCARDEEIAQCFLANENIDLIVNVVSATNLERHCYLTTQCHDFAIPVVIAVNMIDIAEKRNLHLDLNQLSEFLDMPCCPLSATRGDGITALKQLILSHINDTPQRQPLYHLEDKAQAAVEQLAATIAQRYPHIQDSLHCAQRLLEGVRSRLPSDLDAQVKQAQQIAVDTIYSVYHEDADIVLIEQRYQAIERLLTKVKTNQQAKPARVWTDRIDSIFLNKYLGIPCFLGMMYLLFFMAINVGGAFQEFFELTSEAIFVDGIENCLQYLNAPHWLVATLSDGVGRGISTTITFIPVIGAMFLFMGLLEDSGYMSRAAFVMDRGMRSIGLPGKAFVPMLIGFGCNVPAVMAARNLDNARDRILTSMMIPFMSCGARLAIFAVFVAAFFHHGGHNVIFALYLIGLLTAMLTAFLLRRTQFQGETAPFIMELPTYQRPHLPKILRMSKQRLMSFITRAGKVIIPVCIALGLLNNITVQHQANHDTTLIEIVGKSATPVFAPMGLTEDNWPATVGLVSGILAKEVVVGTLNSLYGQIADLEFEQEQESIPKKLLAAVKSIPHNLGELLPALLNPLAASSPDEQFDHHVFGMLDQYFDGRVGAFAYLLFVLLYFPCVSTVAVMRKEIGPRWAWFSMLWSTGLAYIIATDFYQLAIFARQPLFSSLWLSASLLLILITLKLLKHKRIDTTFPLQGAQT